MERPAFLKMIEQNYTRLMRRCKLASDAFDIVNSVIADILEKKTYKSVRLKKGSSVGWLMRAVCHKEIDFMRRRAFERGLFANLSDYINSASAPRSAVDLSAACRIAIGKLSPLQQLIVERVYLGNETYSSLAEQTGIPMKMLKIAGRIARNDLRKALWAKGG